MAQNKDLVADAQTLLEENLSEKKSVESARSLHFRYLRSSLNFGNGYEKQLLSKSYLVSSDLNERHTIKGSFITSILGRLASAFPEI